MAIPRADRDLLRAQAQGGRAGAGRWQRAHAESASSRNRIINRALKESAMRGVPLGAQRLQSGQLARADAQNWNASSADRQSYLREMRGSNQRWDNYEDAINATRSLIADQVRQSVAPIRAAGQFELAGMRAESRANIDSIEAQTRLQQAQMEAAAAAYERQLEEARRAARASGGGGGGGTLEEDELGALLAAQAQNILGGSIEETAQTVGRRRTKARRTYNVDDAHERLNALMQAPPAVTPDEQASRDLRIQELQQEIESGGMRRPSRALRQMSQPRPSSFYEDYYNPPNEYYYDVPGPIANPDPNRVPAPVYGTDVPGPPTLLNQPTAGPDIYQVMAAQRAANAANQAQAQRGEFGSYLRETFPQGFATATGGLGNRLEDVAPGASQLLGLVQEPAYRPRDIAQQLGGEFARGQGVPDETAPQALDLATGLAANRLRNRYEFTGPEYLAAADAAFDPDATYADLLAAQKGTPTQSEAYAAAQKVAAARPTPFERRQAGLDRGERREEERFEDESEGRTRGGWMMEDQQNAQQAEDAGWAQDFYDTFNVQYDPSMGDVNFVEATVATPGFGDALAAVKQRVFSVVDEAGQPLTDATGRPLEEPMSADEAMNALGIEDLGVRQLIAQMVSA